jgi:hypothetical protein
MEELIKYFAKPENGILGIIIIMLLMTIGGLIKVIMDFTKRNDKLNEEIKSLNAALNIVQEKRIGDYDKNQGNLLVLGKDLINNDSVLKDLLTRIANILDAKKYNL